ncbi:hypothetical protein [Marinobacter xiaoshiensis]|uniref:Uncharacterized protein n=1 Tax=Marinobacter xiaoshiensis TaxID=3073652 RepID=A0ABU2HJH2_9GAMM|nr:hypothetical protein [Marinobacter sp. F60267]MDS1311211.1 hypothetical protein [Marinobacter sp. F60267]
MASIPPMESVLAFLRQVFQAGPPDKKRKQLESFRKGFDYQLKTIQDYTDDILKALGLNADQRRDARINFARWETLNGFLERNTWVGQADMRQVLWMLSTHVYAPGLARHLAFWDYQARTDEGMPGGEFWYLPSPSVENPAELTMPVQKTLEWLLDLMDYSINDLSRMLAESNTVFSKDGEAVADFKSIQKTLNSWFTGVPTPEMNTIEAYFNDALLLQFPGGLERNKNLNADEKLTAFVDFVRRKGLSETELSRQIPIGGAKGAELLMAGKADDEGKKYAYSLLCDRYATPSIARVRHRLRIAAAAQDTYKRLYQTLHGREGNLLGTCPNTNKALQVFMIFQDIYNLTIECCDQTTTENEEKSLFAQRLQKRRPLHACTTYLAVLSFDSAIQQLSNRLNQYFIKSLPGEPLEDEAPLNSPENELNKSIVSKIETLEAMAEVEKQTERLLSAQNWGQLHKAIPETNNWVALNNLASIDGVNLTARMAAATRMIQLADSSTKKVYSYICLLGQFLNDPDKRSRPGNAETIVEALLKRLRTASPSDRFDAFILQFEAKHALSQNDFSTAKEKLDLALDCCRVNGFGELRGETARDALAVYAGMKPAGFNAKACEKYKLLFLRYGGAEWPVTSIPDTQKMIDGAIEYFWHYLYQPYQGYERLNPGTVSASQ